MMLEGVIEWKKIKERNRLFVGEIEIISILSCMNGRKVKINIEVLE